MTKQNVISVLLIFIASHILVWRFQIKINIGVIQSIMVWCSIWMGFIITSLVALIDSRYSKYLYKHVKYSSGQNGLEVVVSYFRWSSYFLLMTVALAILCILYHEEGSLHFLQSIINHIAHIVVSLACINFYMSWILIRILLRAVHTDGSLDYDNFK